MLTILNQRFTKYAKLCAIKARAFAGIRPVIDQYYFAYGGNLSPKRFKRARMNFEFFGACSTPEYSLEFSSPSEFIGKGYATLTRREGQQQPCWGTLFKMDTLSLSLLDTMEWVKHGFYTRQRVLVEHPTLGQVEAWAYITVYPNSSRVPSCLYLSNIIKAAREYSFPDSYIDFLTSFESVAQERFELDHDFDLTSPGNPRSIPSVLRPFYVIHDRLRDRLANLLP